MEIYIVFYFWQSDLSRDTNLAAIRQCLRSAINKIENESENLRIELDEATRNTPGSPNIPQIIFNKIENSDIFICDLSTINNTSNEPRKVQNPNVLIELGYAISTLGWNRIILLFNNFHGTFPNDLPFDIDRHRATPFSITNKNDNNGKNHLVNNLLTALISIIKSSPLRPHELKLISPEQRKKERDNKNLTNVLNCLNYTTLDQFLDTFPTHIPSKILFYNEYLESVVTSQTFYLYDENLRTKIISFKNNLSTGLAFFNHYMPSANGKFYSFHNTSKQSEIDFNFLLEQKEIIKNNLSELLNYVRENYLEIDLEETSNTALQAYKRTFEENNLN